MADDSLSLSRRKLMQGAAAGMRRRLRVAYPRKTMSAPRRAPTPLPARRLQHCHTIHAAFILTRHFPSGSSRGPGWRAP